MIKFFFSNFYLASIYKENIIRYSAAVESDSSSEIFSFTEQVAAHENRENILVEDETDYETEANSLGEEEHQEEVISASREADVDFKYEYAQNEISIGVQDVQGKQ